jgi:hypothetical protein
MNLFEVSETSLLCVFEKSIDKNARPLFSLFAVHHLDDFSRDIPEDFRSRAT